MNDERTAELLNGAEPTETEEFLAEMGGLELSGPELEWEICEQMGSEGTDDDVSAMVLLIRARGLPWPMSDDAFYALWSEIIDNAHDPRH